MAVGPAPRFDTLAVSRRLTWGGPACGLSAGEVWCWSGQPPARVAVSQRIVSLLDDGACGLAEDRAKWCWFNVSAPVRIPGEARFVQVAGGYSHSCGLQADGNAYCWGGNHLGQLGNGTVVPGGRIPEESATRVMAAERFVEIGAAGYFGCGLAQSGRVYCWGHGDRGQLGNGGADTQAAPEPVLSDVPFGSLEVTQNRVCALSRLGDLHCWGHRMDGSGQITRVPSAVGTRWRFRSLSASISNVCGVATTGETLCWGGSGMGDTGTGLTTPQTDFAGVLPPGS